LPEYKRSSFYLYLTVAAASVAGMTTIGFAQAGATSARISEIHYEVIFTAASAARRQVTSEMRFTVGGEAPVILSLPSWTPGSYAINNFARNASNFYAEQAGAELRWDKIDHDSWRVFPRSAGPVRVRFEYKADSLENEGSWSRSDFLLFNGTNLFLYPEASSLDFPATVTVTTEAAWKVVTGMTSTGERTFTERNYHDLVDMPFFVGRFDVDSVQIAGRWLRLATYPAGTVPAAERAAVFEALNRVVPPQVRVFGEVPWTTYSILQIVDSAQPGGSGLEHQNSHVDILNPDMVGAPVLISLYAHEIFHAWNVKRLRPADLTPYRYDQPQPSTLLWISEGITDYYADLAQVRGGTVNARGFYDLLTEKIAEVALLPPTALEDASLSAWIRPRDGTEYLYYSKGALAGLLLDIMIRDATDNRGSLDRVMRSLYQSTYRNGRGFTSDDWWSAVSREANGKSFDDFSARYVDGREPYPFERILPLAGLRLGGDPVREPRVGIATMQDTSGFYVTDLGPGSPPLPPGLESGDRLLAVGGISVHDPAWLEKFRARYARASEGTEVPVRIQRDGRDQTVRVRLRFVTQVDPRVVEDPRASSKARRIRDGLLRGVTRP
jgi:predicted metalloprotease with PDZ domain